MSLSQTSLTSPEAQRAVTALIKARARELLRPPPKLSLSEWADRYRVLSRENTAEPGRWRTIRVACLREIMDAITDPRVESVVFQKPSRIGATEAVIVNTIGYFIDQDPSPILVVQPTLDDAAKFSKEKLKPMLEATPRVGRRIHPPRSKDSENTILNKKFPGGKLGIIGTNAPRQFRQRDFRVVLFDEVDGYATNPEGDSIALGKRRADNFGNRKFLEQSSPTLKDISRIEASYKNSDQRKWHVTCPHCGHEQQWLWHHLRWEKEGEGEAQRHLTETVYYACAGSGCVITEADKIRMNETGRWIAQNPGHRVRGYQCSALASNLAGAKWSKLVEEWLVAQTSLEQLQAFINTVLAETYEVPGERAHADTLAARREPYAAEVPLGVGVLTAAVDVHDDRLEVLVRGWGIGQESWRITHDVITGNPEEEDVWATLDGVLFRPYEHESGAQIRIRATLVDHGHKSSIVNSYVKPRQLRGVWAAKGDKQDPTRPLITKAKKPNDVGVKLLTIGTFNAKRRLFQRLRLTKGGPEPKPGYMHFNTVSGDREAQDLQFFKQFEAEKLVPGRDKFGQRTLNYVQVDLRNEAIDLECLAFCALYVLGAPVYEHLDREVERIQRKGARAVASGSETAAAPPAPRRAPRRSAFVNSWRR